MTAECGPGGEETGRLLANLSESRSNDNSPGSRETEIRIPAPPLDYNRIGDTCCNLSRDLQMWLKCGSTTELSAVHGAWQVLRKYQLIPTYGLHVFTTHTRYLQSLPFPSPHAQSDTCCFCGSNVSHIPSLLSIELLHQGHFQLL